MKKLYVAFIRGIRMTDAAIFFLPARGHATFSSDSKCRFVLIPLAERFEMNSKFEWKCFQGALFCTTTTVFVEFVEETCSF